MALSQWLPVKSKKNPLLLAFQGQRTVYIPTHLSLSHPFCPHRIYCPRILLEMTSPAKSLTMRILHVIGGYRVNVNHAPTCVHVQEYLNSCVLSTACTNWRGIPVHWHCHWKCTKERIFHSLSKCSISWLFTHWTFFLQVCRECWWFSLEPSLVISSWWENSIHKLTWWCPYRI